MESIETVTAKIEKYIKKNLSEHRYSHSMRVADMCVEIAERCDYDKQKAYLAGISHDIAKEIPKPKMVEIVKKSKYSVCEYEMQHLSLLHGKAGAYILETKFGVKDEEVLGAVAYHVSGTLDYGKLGKIIYIADKNERGRDFVTDEYIERLYSMNLDDMFSYAYKNVYDYMKEKNFTIYEDTYRILEELKLGKKIWQK